MSIQDLFGNLRFLPLCKFMYLTEFHREEKYLEQFGSVLTSVPLFLFKMKIDID